MSRGVRGALAVLAVAAVLRLALHAVFLPAFEGPDEPHHLARVLAFASEPAAAAFAGRTVAPAIVAAVRARPCGPSLARAYGCSPFGPERAMFNVLSPSSAAAAAEARDTPEGNQPPLFYLLAGLPLRLAGAVPGPEGLLLYARLFNVLLVAIAIFGPLRAIAAARPPVYAALFLLALLLPGAAESLARSANDASVFLWSTFVLLGLDRRWRGSAVAALLAAGPLLKLTAFPIVAFAVVALWQERRTRAALAGAAASCTVFLVQGLRGWNWGGTVELNHPTAAISEGTIALAAGLARSVCAFAKTTFWLGGWSFFRAPGALVAAFALLILAWVLGARRLARPSRGLAHLAAAATAAAGFLAFALANRRFFGVWGGVGGWYAWAWWPWIVVGLADVASVSRKASRALLAATAVFVLVANVLWFAAAVGLYGTLAG